MSMNITQNQNSNAISSRENRLQTDFMLACATGSTKGTGVIPIGKPGEHNLKAIMAENIAANGGEPLDQIVATHSQGNKLMGLPGLVSFYKQQKYIKDDSTFALLGGYYHPKALQDVADKNPGMKFAFQQHNHEKGVTVYEHGKEPRFDPEGSISDGGYGSRSCGTKPGYTPGMNESTKTSSRLI